MAPRGSVALAVVLFVVLAGCTGSDAAPATTSAPIAPPPTTTPETGSIAGTVSDEEARPVPGVDVALLESGNKTQSDAAGSFVFNDLAPGKYRLALQRLGYESAARVVEVAAGEVSRVAIQVRVVLIKPDPFFAMTPYDGFLQCSVNPIYPINPCGGVTGADKDQFFFTTDKNHSLEEGVFELVWTPATAGTGQELELDLCDAASTETQEILCIDATWDNYKSGESPVVIRVDDMPVNKTKQFLTGAGQGVGSAYPVFQQSFKIYATLCYYEACAEDYSALPK